MNMDDLRQQRYEKSFVIRAESTMPDQCLDLRQRLWITQAKDTGTGFQTLGKCAAWWRLDAAHREREDLRDEDEVTLGEHWLTTGKRHQATALDHGAVEGASEFRALNQPPTAARHEL